MEKDAITKARINLFAVLRNLEDLCDMDYESKELIKDEKLSVQFTVPEVGSAVLKFENGKCTFTRGKGKAGLKLYFNSPDHFNKLMGGDKTVPIFFNVFKVNFLLKTFTKLAERLTYYLAPTPEERVKRNKDPEFFKTSTILTAYTAFFAISEIGNSDKIGKLIASSIPEGIIQAKINDKSGDVGISINIDGKGHMTTYKGVEEGKGRAFMTFEGIDNANAVLNGELDFYSGLGMGVLAIYGLTPMMDGMSKILAKVPAYLS